MGLPMDKSYLLTQLRNFKSIILDPAYIIQKTTLPTATVDLEGVIYQYIGNSSSLTLGGFYQCQSDGAVSPTYSWVEIPVKIDTDGTTVLKNSNGELYVPTATASALGLVKAGDGTAINNGALDVVDRIKIVSLMPTASASLVGTAVMFLGTTGTYTRGSIYECVSDGESTPTYSWEILLNADNTAEIEALTNQVKDMNNVLGAKNLLKSTLKTNTYDGLTFTVGADGSVTLSGTATSSCGVNGWGNFGTFSYPAGNYILSDGGAGSQAANKRMYYRINNGNSQGVVDSADITLVDGDLLMVWIYVDQGVSGDGSVFYPMLRLASDTDNTYQPYAKTNQQLTEDKAEQVEVNNIVNVYGAKNLLPFPYYESRSSINGVTCVINSDGSITFNGTATGMVYFNCTFTEKIVDFGDVSFNSIAPSHAPYIATLENGDNNVYLSYNRINKITSINIVGGTVCNNLTVYPMIRLASIQDDTYEPYAKTNQQLTEDTTALLDNLEVNGAVNMLPYPYSDSNKVDQGVTFIDNGDGTISVNGTASQDTVAAFYFTQPKSSYLPAGTYKLTVEGRVGSNTSSPDWYYIYNQTTGQDLANPLISIFTYNGTDTLFFRYTVAKGQTVSTTLKPMITVASYNGDYVPYAKSNKELTKETTGLIENVEVNGAVNILPIDLNYIKANNSASSWSGNACTHNGVTYTIDEANGKITVNGTASARSTLQVYDAIAGDLFKKSFKYLAKVFNNNFNTVNGYYVQLYMTNSPYTRIDTFTGNNFVVPDSFFDNSIRVSIQIVVENGKSVDNQVITPLIAFGNYTGGFEKYAKTNRELTNALAKNVYSTLKRFESLTPSLIYTVPEEGYLNVVSSNGQGYVIVQDANGNQLGEVGHCSSATILLKKGMKVVLPSTSSYIPNDVRFRY